MLCAAVLGAAGAGLAPSVAHANTDYVPGEIVVGYAPGPSASLAAELGARTGLHIGGVPGPGPGTQILHLPPGISVREAIGRLAGERGIAYAVPNFIAHAAGSWIPDDPGSSHRPTGWEALQWNFLPGAGVNAPQAWANLIADGRPGGRGVVVAILDTGVAYRRWHQFRESPDFKGTRFVRPYDFVARNSYPLDRDGHGTFVAGTVAEATNNGVALTGLAYGA
ncbi:MAG: S8 family serine peptidase, partial [Pseudomonadota bacterium]|nr:S8 family serine peptidase [Pseudomonadota bacterium]